MAASKAMADIAILCHRSKKARQNRAAFHMPLYIQFRHNRYAKFATEHLAIAASRIETGTKENVITLSRFCHGDQKQRA
jgi:hypothetical protein